MTIDEPSTPEELELYFSALKEMFKTDGWETLMGELTDQASHLDSIQGCKDNKDFDYKKGQLAVLGYFLSLEDSIGKTEDMYSAHYDEII